MSCSYSCSCSCSPPGSPRQSSVTLRLKRQQHLRDLPPKTFFVSSQIKYVAAISSQLRKGAWLQRSFTLSPVRQGTNQPWWVALFEGSYDERNLPRLFAHQSEHVVLRIPELG